jgi:hypothetical protein
MNVRTDRRRREDGNETLHGLRPIAELMPIVLARRGIDPDLIETPATENAICPRLGPARAPLTSLIEALATA